MVKELAEHYEAGSQLSRYPYEMLDENKWLAARHGLGGSLVDLPDIGRVPVPELARRLLDRLAPHAEELGSTEDLECIEDILENGNGASRQAVVYEANHDLREVVGEIVAATVPEEADIPQEYARVRRRRPPSTLPAVSQPDLFVVCKNCGSEVSPYVTECPYCGQRVRKRAPKIDRSGDAGRGAPSAGARGCRACAPRRSWASPPTPVRTRRSRSSPCRC